MEEKNHNKYGHGGETGFLIFILHRCMYGDCMALPLDTDIMVAYNRYGSVDFIQRVSVDKKG